jgi:hypothetical protein
MFGSGKTGRAMASSGKVLYLSRSFSMTTATRNGKATAIGGMVPTNGGEEAIVAAAPYTVEFTIKGTADILFHRWNCEAVAEKAAAAKGSKAKKSDNVESYVYRNEDDEICLPGEYIRQTIIHAAKYKQDPRSPRKSAMDLFKAGIVCLTELASLGQDKWDYEHMCRVTIQRNGVTRVRPAFKAGWEATFLITVLLPEYISPDLLQDVLVSGGRLVGVADFRPTYGRYAVTRFGLVKQE